MAQNSRIRYPYRQFNFQQEVVMSDALIPAIATSVSTSLSVVIFGVDTGLQYAILIAGIFGGTTALSYLEPGKPFKQACDVISASLFAGYTSPATAGMLTHGLIKATLLAPGTITPPGLELALAFLIAFLAHGVLLPGIRKVLSAMFRRYTNEQ